jgi:hypothetical protein
MRDVLDFLTFSKAFASSHNIHGRDLKSAFCQIQPNDKAPYPANREMGLFLFSMWGLRVSSSSISKRFTGQKLKSMVLKGVEKVKKFGDIGKKDAGC